MKLSKLWFAQVVCMGLCVSSVMAAPVVAKKEAVAHKFIDSLVSAKWDAAMHCCDEELKKALGQGKLKSIWDEVLAKIGMQWPLPRGTEEISSFDGFKLTAKIEVPENLTTDTVKSAIILVHGSGPQNLDGTELHLFQHIARALRKEGFATLRYNKRSFQVNVKAELGELDRKSKEYKDYDENFIK